MNKLASILKRKDAARVLNPDGTIRRKGNHLDPAPRWAVKDANGDMVMMTYRKSAPSALPMAGAAPLVRVNPPMPSDAGSPIDVSAAPFWTNQRPRAGGRQGAQANCYADAVVQSLGQQAEWFLPFMLHRGPLGAAVVFRRAGQPVTVVDFPLVVGSNSDLFDVADNAVGLPLFSRAYAYYRTGANTYASLGWGFAGTVFNDLGVTTMYLSAMHPALMTMIMAALAKGKPVVVHTNSVTDGSVVASHVYSIPAADGTTFTLRNPWFGNGDPNNTQTATPQQVAMNCSAVVIGDEFPVAEPAIKADLNLDGIVDLFDLTLLISKWQQVGVNMPQDINSSGLVDDLDLTGVTGNYQSVVDDTAGAYRSSK